MLDDGHKLIYCSFHLSWGYLSMEHRKKRSKVLQDFSPSLAPFYKFLYVWIVLNLPPRHIEQADWLQFVCSCCNEDAHNPPTHQNHIGALVFERGHLCLWKSSKNAPRLWTVDCFMRPSYAENRSSHPWHSRDTKRLALNKAGKGGCARQDGDIQSDDSFAIWWCSFMFGKSSYSTWLDSSCQFIVVDLCMWKVHHMCSVTCFVNFLSLVLPLYAVITRFFSLAAICCLWAFIFSAALSFTRLQVLLGCVSCAAAKVQAEHWWRCFKAWCQDKSADSS